MEPSFIVKEENIHIFLKEYCLNMDNRNLSIGYRNDILLKKGSISVSTLVLEKDLNLDFGAAKRIIKYYFLISQFDSISDKATLSEVIIF